MTQETKLTKEMRSCVQSCVACHGICVETATHCLELGGKHASAEHVRLLLDCAQICATSADFMLRESPAHGRSCAVCAEICGQCADSCEKLTSGDDLIRRCAEACRRCAESCSSMAAEH